jgi:hypothetical protein
MTLPRIAGRDCCRKRVAPVEGMQITNSQDMTSTIHGTLLRLDDERSVAIYLHDGIVSVAEFNGGRGRLLSVAEWHCFHARKVAHAQRRGEVEILCPIPGEIAAWIGAMHRRLGELNDHPFKRKAARLYRGVTGILSRLARAWPDSAAVGSRMIGAGAFRVD